jgi:hypothetical protein
METITRIYEVLPKTVANLTDSVNWLVKAQNGQDPAIPDLDVHQYATLKQFDLCYIYLIKTGIALLKSQHQITLRLTTPKKVFNTLHQKTLITQDELATLLATIKIRRLTRKCYDETYIERTMQEIIEILPAVTLVAQKMLSKK